jgi:heme A synthase
MKEKVQRNLSTALWASTGVILALLTLQGLSGNWITYFLVLPGGPAGLSQVFIGGLVSLALYHRVTGFIIGFLSILVLILAFVRRWSNYVRLFAVLGFIITALAAMGGYLFVKSGFEDRWALGQMSDAFVGAYAAYFLQLHEQNTHIPPSVERKLA